VDQEQPVIDTRVGGLAIGGSSEQILAQVVTPGTSGMLTEVRLPIGCDSLATLRVEIRGLIEGKPDGSLLAAETFAGNSPPFFPRSGVVTLRSFIFSAPAAVEAGTPIAIVLSATGVAPLIGCGVFQGPIGDSYPGGNLYYDARPNPAMVWVCVCEFSGARFDLPFQIVVAPPVREIAIDVKPGSSHNPIHIGSAGVIPVALFGKDCFDVAAVDVSSIRFGPGEALPTISAARIEDLNLDGLPDLMLHFRTRDSGIQAGDAQVSLSGWTHKGDRFAGNDQIVTVGITLEILKADPNQR
jgi:hypothetical protein